MAICWISRQLLLGFLTRSFLRTRISSTEPYPLTIENISWHLTHSLFNYLWDLQPTASLSIHTLQTERQLLNMDNLAPASVGMDELPDGFTAVNPNGGPQASEAAFKKAAIQEQKQSILEQAMDSQALARLGRIRLVKPEKAASVENTIVSMAMQGKLPGKINEGKLVEILERKSRAEASAASRGSGGIQIQRKRYTLDSDDEDDDDDDI